ncbi:GNAT family N-acetyltransferase [Paenibacillus solisilvae]|uniref:GNAT family N-acetyltransferase n=1 Tax=Paenibacillus solisilvae TaxID=2486751 RepID=A0ABW0VVA6_9BACL
MEINYRQMTIDDYEASFALWSKTEGMVLSEADSKSAIASYLERNPDLSFVCTVGGMLQGTILCGHDGRRGFIYHAAVNPEMRGLGIGSKLVELSLKQLQQAGIMKCHLFVVADNEIGNRFWKRSGWLKREGIAIYSK